MYVFASLFYITSLVEPVFAFILFLFSLSNIFPIRLYATIENLIL